MDVRDNAMVVCTAPRPQPAGGQKSFFHVYDLNNPQAALRAVESPLKFQSRAVRIFSDNQLFVVSSIEGRCAIKPLDARFETCTPGAGCRDNKHFAGCMQLQQGERNDGSGKILAFNFRCHRSPSEHAPLLVYPVNAIDAHPDAQNYSAVFATGGSDGVVCTWQRKERAKVGTDLKGPAIGTEEVANSKTGQKTTFTYQQPVVDVKFSPQGDMLAYACSYDWHKGAEHHKAEQVPSIYVKGLTPKDLMKK
jgi:mRNA export factor